MATASNGKAKKPKKATAQNGHINSHSNTTGSLRGSSTSASSAPTQRKQGRSFIGFLSSMAARLTFWYLVYTICFRCPSSIAKLSDTSPQICKPYLHARSYVTPYLDPYYQTYVAPQIEKAQPYWETFDNKVYTPVSGFTKEKYATYGAHRVEQAQHQLAAQWDKSVRPLLQNVQDRVKGQYDVHLAPYVNRVSDAVMPLYEQTKESTLEIYHLTLLPAYEAALPYSRQAYAHGHYAVTHIVFPYVRTAKNVTWTFITRTLWPQLRILYGDNVEPQLVRIRERLGRHRDQQKIESAVDAAESSISEVYEKQATQSTQSSQSTKNAQSTQSTQSTQSQASAESAASEKPAGTGWDLLNDLWPSDSLSTATEKAKSQTATQPAEPKLTGAELREKLNNDLRQWQGKFAVAADKGAEDLEQRVDEITERQVENGVKGHGAALLVQLEETANSTIAGFKKIILQTVQSLPEDPTEEDLESAYEKCVAKTRELGLSVKEKAQAIRTWKARYDAETDALVRAAVKSTVEVLERIHGLGLQEVGMRWAWTDGVTYKDWQKYHKVRNTLTEWQAEVEAVGSRHEGLKFAHEEAKQLEDKAMGIASSMVSELVRLKEVSRWKIWAGDATDDFSTRAVPARAFKAAKNVASNVEEAASKVSGSVVGSETPVSESVASNIKDKASSASSQAASVAGSAASSGSSAASIASEKVADASSQAASLAGSAASKASDAIADAETGAASQASAATENVKSQASKAQEAVKEKASLASPERKQQKVMGGAMAQVLAEAREIVFDDEEDEADTYSQKLQEMVGEAGERAADLSRAVSEALLGPTKTQGKVESATSVANEQYKAAIAAASKVLYGTEQQPLESATSAASEKFAAAVTAASYAIYGTPTPTAIYQTVHVQASSRYDQAVSLANEQYSNVKSQISVLASGTPKPAHESMLSMMDKAYSDSLASASEKLQQALQYTDSIKGLTASETQGYFESVSSIASSKLSEGLSLASAQFTAQPTPALEGARRQYYEAIGAAHARYQEFLDSASTAVYGPKQGTIQSIASGVSESAQSAASQVSEAAESLATQASSSVIGSETPWTESVASQASQNWEALIAKASEQVYGSPTPWGQSVYSQAGAYGAQATAQAVAQYVAVQALVSELVVGKEPDFTESVMMRLSSAYYTGLGDAFASASSYASANVEAASSLAGEGYDHVTSVAGEAYESASSAISSIFTPPPAIETVLSQASEQINLAVESASIAVYGTPKGKVEQASESIADAYSSVQSKASEAIYGTQQAQDRFAAITANAQAAISEAIFGTPTAAGFVVTATDSAGSVYSSVTSVVGEKAADAVSAVSSAIYGPEQGAVESASSRLAAAVEAANSRIAEIYANAGDTAGSAASSASSIMSKATQGVKDEL